MSAPHFLVIGAMKSGTTTLYHDLCLNPNIFLPDKETNGLARNISLSEYQSGFHKAAKGKICGDVSTVYAMLPDSADVLTRARQFLSNQTKIIYVVRDPISRTLSHHNHMRTWTGQSQMSSDINADIIHRPELINYSRYAMQLRPWIQLFGRANVHVIVFEEYVRQRKTTISELSRFLGIEPHVDRIDETVIHNQSDGKPLAIGGWQGISQSAFYRTFIRPFTSLATRDIIRRILLPKATDDNRTPPTEETLNLILNGVYEDACELSHLIGRTSPIWNLNQTKQKILDKTTPKARTSKAA